MNVNPTADPGGQTVSSSAAQNSLLDYDAFLQLMLAQMKNQDPTEPVDPTTQLAQLASFSQVGQSIQTNAKLDALLSSVALAQAEAVIGRTVTAADGALSGKVVSLSIVSDGTVATLEDGRKITMGPGVTIA